jgi:hypothetical protein
VSGGRGPAEVVCCQVVSEPDSCLYISGKGVIHTSSGIRARTSVCIFQAEGEDKRRQSVGDSVMVVCR